MSERSRSKNQPNWDWSFEGARRHHILAGLKLSPSERLRWLEETVDEMRRLQGLARKGRRIGESGP